MRPDQWSEPSNGAPNNTQIQIAANEASAINRIDIPPSLFVLPDVSILSKRSRNGAGVMTQCETAQIA